MLINFRDGFYQDLDKHPNLNQLFDRTELELRIAIAVEDKSIWLKLHKDVPNVWLVPANVHRKAADLAVILVHYPMDSVENVAVVCLSQGKPRELIDQLDWTKGQINEFVRQLT